MTEDEIERLRDGFLNLSKQVLTLDSAVADLRASVSVLRVCVAALLSPDDPTEGLKGLQRLEQLAADQKGDQERQQALEVVEALQTWIKRGRPPLDT
jgi:hypothetical protein